MQFDILVIAISAIVTLAYIGLCVELRARRHFVLASIGEFGALFATATALFLAIISTL